MAKGKNTFNLYADMIGVFEKLPDDKAGQLIKHIFRYVNDQHPETDDLLIGIAFEPIKAKLKRDLVAWTEKCEKNTENIRKRWNKNDTTVYDRIPNYTKHTDKDKDKDKDKDMDKVKDKVSKFIKPTLEEITQYCKERKNAVNPQKWLDHYTSNGWMVGRNPMKDWKSAVRTWETNKFNNGGEMSSEERGVEVARLLAESRG